VKNVSPKIILCNGANLPDELKKENAKIIQLEYRDYTKWKQNVKISLPYFISYVNYLPDRIVDLLEIAAYVFCADRFMCRGNKNTLEYHSWSRSFLFVIKVRDFEFWNTPCIQKKLEDALCFMSGDQEYKFTFQPGHKTPLTGLFEKEEFKIEPNADLDIILFSGGLDSLAGILDRLENSKNELCLISHQSGQPGTIRTQEQLFKALKRRCGNRVSHYKFRCGLTGVKAVEESQRTRSFLYSSIAYALCHGLSQNKFYVYENGITSLNFPKRQDLINARASRTTHPKTLRLLEDLFYKIEESKIKIHTPFLWKTKTDIFNMIANFGYQNLITSTVSCSKTFQNLGSATHCGGCSQCIDRKFAAYGAKLDDIDDSGIYKLNFINQKTEGEAKTTLVDYVRQARNFAEWNIDHFYNQMLNYLIHITENVSGLSEHEAIEKTWDLCRRHGNQVLKAIKRMRDIHDNPFCEVPEGSFLHMISEREYLKEPVQRLVADIYNRLSRAIPIAFQKNLPKNENDFNDKVSAILDSYKEDLEREHPAVLFALARAIPDHSLRGNKLLIESKYIRGSTSPSKASEGIAADLIKYSESSHILFIVYDPQHSIVDDEKFKSDFEKKGRCNICIIR